MSPEPHTLGHVLLVGAKGMLGRELAEQLAARVGDGRAGCVTCWDLEDIDIGERNSVLRKIADVSPDIVINSAACTDVDGCETNEALATAVNGDGPANLAEACKRGDALLVQISTDYVFDGSAQHPYRPGDTPHPLSAYGRSKLAGECRVIDSGARHLIVRTSWLFGAHGKNFVAAILGRAEAGEALRVVDDQVGRPTLASDLADAVLRLVDCAAHGVYHFANRGWCSWHAFAEQIVAASGCDVPVEAISSSELNRPAPRPAYSVLDTTDYEQTTGATPADWQDALIRYLALRQTSMTVENRT